MKKKCRVCKVKLTIENVYKEKLGKYGVMSICKKCLKKRNIIWLKNNPEKKQLLGKQWRSNNKEHIKEYNKEYSKQWHKNNPEYFKQWAKDNPDKVKEYKKQWDLNNPGGYNKYIKERKKTDINFNILCKCRCRQHHALRGTTK